MERRWIVPDPKFKGHLKLVVGEPRPADAICEAPHNFTTDMEPYLEIYHVFGPNPGDMPETKVKWHHQYLEDLKLGKLKKKNDVVPHESAEHHIEQALEQKRMTVTEIHNSLNPAQRFAYSILGPMAHSPRPFMKLIFGDKLLGNGFVAGVKVDV